MNFERFTWLLRREWMQHHRGWLLLVLVPIGLALVLVLMPFATIDLDGEPPAAPLLGLLAASVCIYGVMALVAATVVFQAAGIARRDQQDRSIEFWLSLPTGHWQSVFATVLMHLLMMPLMALLIAFVGAQLLAMAVVVKLSGFGALGQMLDPAWFGTIAAVLLRQVVGVGVAALWMSPLVLVAMAAASWLKGWGVPALVAATVVVGVLVKQYTGSTVISDTLTHWFTETLAALMPLAHPDAESRVNAAIHAGSALEGFAQWMWNDIGMMLIDLATPALAAALVVAGIGFALVVLRRAGGLSARLPWSPRSA